VRDGWASSDCLSSFVLQTLGINGICERVAGKGNKTQKGCQQRQQEKRKKERKKERGVNKRCHPPIDGAVFFGRVWGFDYLEVAKCREQRGWKFLTPPRLASHMPFSGAEERGHTQSGEERSGSN
jgi:hypothetical protein